MKFKHLLIIRFKQFKRHAFTRGAKIAVVTSLVFISAATQANPLFVADSPLAAPGKLRIDYALSYNLVDQNFGGVTALSETIQVAPTFRYGIGEKTDIALSPSVSIGQEQFGSASKSSARLDGLTLALSHSFLADKGPDGLIGSIKVPLVENIGAQDKKYAYLRSATLGLTKYYLLDPISLSASGSVTAFRGVNINGLTVKPGLAVTLGFDVGFAVNRNVTLYGGLAWNTALRGQSLSTQDLNRSSTITKSFGVGYRDDAGTLWGLSLTGGSSNGSNISLTVTPGASKAKPTLKNTP